MTLPKITQENVHIFIPLKVAKVCERFSRNKNISKKQALLEFYNSKTYANLEIEDTKLWYEGVNSIYEQLEDEKKTH